MSYSISTLLTRNLDDVFGENDAARRRAAIDGIFTEDCVLVKGSRSGGLRNTRSTVGRTRYGIHSAEARKCSDR
jgi:hypothetical protein